MGQARIGRRAVLAGLGASIVMPSLVRAAESGIYYFDAIAGHDNASGISPGDPFRSLARIGGLPAGSRCLLSNNATWNVADAGTLNPPAGLPGKPTVIDAYGTGSSLPKISGAISVEGFAPVVRRPNLWVAPFPAAGYAPLLHDPAQDLLFWGIRANGTAPDVLASLTQAGDYYVDQQARRLYVYAIAQPSQLTASLGSPLCFVQQPYVELANLWFDFGQTGVKITGNGTREVSNVALRNIRATRHCIAGIMISAGTWNAPAGAPPNNTRAIEIANPDISLTGSSGIAAACPGVMGGRPQGVGDYQGLRITGGKIDLASQNYSEPLDNTLGYSAGIKLFGATAGNTDLLIDGVSITRSGNFDHPPGTSGDGVWLDTLPAKAATVRNITATGNRLSGIFVEESVGQQVSGNTCRSNAIGLAAITDQIRHGGISLYRGTRDCQVDHNQCADNGGAQIVCYAETEAGSAENPDWRTTGNQIHDNVLTAPAGVPLISLGTSGRFADVEGNEFAQNKLGGKPLFRGSQRNGGDIVYFESLNEWERAGNRLAHGRKTESISSVE